MHVVIEGLYGDHYISMETFDPKRYMVMLEAYKRIAESEPVAYSDRVRNYVRLVLYDAETGDEFDDPEELRAALEANGKWVDELPLSTVFGPEEESLLGESGQEDREVHEVQHNDYDEAREAYECYSAFGLHY